MKLWEKGYKLNKLIEDFTVGNDYVLDQELVEYDCITSIVHAKMLGKIGILNKKEVKRLVRELNNIIRLNKKGNFKISKQQEDCHTAIENYLTKELGDLGEKIHTARSRNDQVLTALRLYCKKELVDCQQSVNELIKTVKNFLKRYGEVKLPGYTHTRKAMPSSVRMWGTSLIDSMKDNLELVDLSLNLIDQSPLGTGAGYGVPIKIDRVYTAKELGFKKIQRNPIYTQNSRGKFESTILHSLSQIMLDLNKIATDLIIFSLPELGYFELPQTLCTGSSLMPHKRNPDVLELLRAEYHVVLGCEFQVKGIISNLPSGYNRDLQLTKEPIIKALAITKESLSVAAVVFRSLKVNKENCSRALIKDIYATEKVYQLVKKGIPFRRAYRIISKEY